MGCLIFSSGLIEGLGVDAWKTASALTAKNIGGGLNFMAVAGQLNVSPQAIAAALTVDNILGLVYFPSLAFIGRGAARDVQSHNNHRGGGDGGGGVGDDGDGGEELVPADSISSQVTFEGLAGMHGHALQSHPTLNQKQDWRDENHNSTGMVKT